jgi:hypothetical protein
MSLTDMASPVLKCDGSPQLVAQIQKIENQCNKWADGFVLANFTYDVAVWGALTQVVDLIEQHISKFGHGSQEQREAMMNLGRASALLLDALHGTKLPVKPVWLKWTSELKGASRQAVLAAHNCENFISCFTMWHKCRYAVEIISPTHLRFSIPPSPMDRRIRAYQQGCRVPHWPSTPDNPVDKRFVNDPDVNKLLARLSNRVTLEGALAIRYPDDSELLSHLRDIEDDNLRRAFRRDPLLDLGGYNLDAFRQFFAVLLSICAVHEYLCDEWFKRSGRYPFESAVMVKSLSEWVGMIAGLCRAEESRVRLMITDLTFGSIRPLDIYLQPFVPSLDGQTLFLVPHFIMNSRAEENILRVCSYARPDNYRPIANAKEREMRERIKKDAPSRYAVIGPLKLRDPKLPDIDVLIKDAKVSAALVGELKWLMKTTRPIELLDRDAKLDEGFQQLRDVREFLERFPDFLKERGVIKKSEHQPCLSYAVIARDHLGYIPQQEGLWIAEFDALIWALQKSGDLTEVIHKLQNFEWLPVEDRDFTVRFESSRLAGVTIDSEIFHRPPDHA